MDRYIICKIPVSTSLVNDPMFDLTSFIRQACIAHAQAYYADTPYAESEMMIKSIDGPFVLYDDEFPGTMQYARYAVGRVGPAELNAGEDITVRSVRHKQTEIDGKIVELP